MKIVEIAVIIDYILIRIQLIYIFEGFRDLRRVDMLIMFLYLSL